MLSSHPTIRVQSVLYNLAVENVERALEYLDNAALLARRQGFAKNVSVAYGDCSPNKILSDQDLDHLRGRFKNLTNIDYSFFGTNLGSAAGHNSLLKAANSDFVMIMNPDVLVAPNLFEELLQPFSQNRVGLVEARQTPIEHPKDYDVTTGETSWASTACAIGPLAVFTEVSGFDSDTFFLYCDDVDFSWRVRLAGYKIIHRRSAAVYHDKRLSNTGNWIAGAAEQYYAAEAALLLPFKYSRPDLAEINLAYFQNSEDESLLKAASAFEARRAAGRLPEPIDVDHLVGEFTDGTYSRHRF